MAYSVNAIIAMIILILLRSVYNLAKISIKARKIGLPVVFAPVDQIHLLWVLLAPPNRNRIRWLLPEKVWKRVALTIFGWEFKEKLRPFDEYVPGHGDGKGAGRSFLLLGLRKSELWTADPVAANDVLTRVREYEVPAAIGYALGTYGPNVLTTNGDRWVRHRKIITSVLDERIMREVFGESIRQTRGLLDDVFAEPEGEPQPGSTETRQLFDMLKRVTIHVLLGTSMGVKVPWHGRSQEVEPGHRMPHIESLNTMVVNIVGVGMLPKKLLLGWPRWLPGYKEMTRVGCAKVEVENRSKAILDEERGRMSQGDKATRPTIVSKILRASEQGREHGPAMSEVEMVSNLFIVTAAGFETTATTLAYAVVLLARYPQWQEWLLDEVDSLAATATTEEGLMDYSSVFPRAHRTLAFMFETLRLFPPVPHVHRETTAPQTLQTMTGPIHVPAGTRVYINSLALHILPSWRDTNRESDPPFLRSASHETTAGPDELVFRPSRWLNPPGSAQTHYHPPKGTWVPWAMGPRVCPGIKMAQVEFTAVMLTMLQKHRIEAVPLAGENTGAMGKRLDARLQDSRWVTVLQMNGVFEPREGEGLCIRLSRRNA